jgi:acyl carrier protein
LPRPTEAEVAKNGRQTTKRPNQEALHMDNQEIQARVVKVVCHVLGVDAEMVQPESHFVFDLGAESSQSTQLVMAFEGEFGIEMDEEAALQVKTVGDAVEFIGRYTVNGDRGEGK